MKLLKVTRFTTYDYEGMLKVLETAREVGLVASIQTKMEDFSDLYSNPELKYDVQLMQEVE